MVNVAPDANQTLKYSQIFEEHPNIRKRPFWPDTGPFAELKKCWLPQRQIWWCEKAKNMQSYWSLPVIGQAPSTKEKTSTPFCNQNKKRNKQVKNKSIEWLATSVKKLTTATVALAKTQESIIYQNKQEMAKLASPQARCKISKWNSEL